MWLLIKSGDSKLVKQFFLVIFLYFCTSPLLSQERGIILGKVSEGIRGVPIADVSLSLRDRQGLRPFLPPPPSTKTDENGNYELKYVEIGGEYMVDAVCVFDFDTVKIKHTLTASSVQILSDSTIVNFQFSRQKALEHLSNKEKRNEKKKEDLKALQRKLKQKNDEDTLEELLSMEYDLFFGRFRITDEYGNVLTKFSHFERIKK